MPDKLILIVEDNEHSMKLERDVLELHGYRTLQARTAEEGIDLAIANVPELILMDIRLPGMNGDEALQRLRAEAQTSRIPVIALTSSATSDDHERLHAAGFDGYLAKPMGLKEFLAEVAARCGESVAESRNASSAPQP